MEGTPLSTPRPTATLGPPVIYGAQDGGLGYNDLLGTPDARVYVTCDTVIGDFAFKAVLLWDGEVLAEMPVPDGTQTPTFTIPGATLAGTRKPGEDAYTGDGLHALTYQYVYFDGTDTSAITEVRVKCSLPGGEDPNGATPYINEGLAKPTITPSPVPDDPNVIVLVTFPRWKNIAAGDVVTVEWAGYKFPLPPITAPDQPQLPFATLLYDDLVRAGGGQHVPVSYYIYDAAHNWSKYAPFADPTVEIDPGTLTAPKILEATGNVLDLGKLGSAAATVQVGTRPLQLDDEVTVHWLGTDSNGTELPYNPPPLTFDDEDAFVLEFSIPNDVARATAGGNVALHYTTSTGGTSKIARYRVTEQPEASLPAPVVPGAADGELDPFAQGASVTIHVPFDAGQMFLGDIVTMHVVGTRGSATRIWEDGVSLSSNDLKDPVPFYCPSEVLQAVDQGQATFEYDVRSATGVARGMFSTQANERKSEVLTLAIRRASALPPPIIADVKDGVLDPDLPQTLVEIPASASAKPGTRVDLHWEGAVSTHPYSLVPSSGTLKFRIDKTYITGNRDSYVTVTYNIRRESEAVRFLVGTHDPFFIDPSEMLLAVGGTQTREAQGGTSPYAYQSSQTAVASVSANGLVTANAPGDAVITASDAASHSGTYPVHVQAPFYIDTSTMTLAVGGSGQRSATGGTLPYAYASSDASVATVNATNGNVSAKKVGSTAITASDAASGSGTYIVQVQNPFHIDTSNMTLEIGQASTRSASGGTPPYTYSSANPSIASASAQGSVMGVAAGSTIITARDRADGSGSFRVTVIGPQRGIEDFETAALGNIPIGWVDRPYCTYQSPEQKAVITTGAGQPMNGKHVYLAPQPALASAALNVVPKMDCRSIRLSYYGTGDGLSAPLGTISFADGSKNSFQLTGSGTFSSGPTKSIRSLNFFTYEGGSLRIDNIEFNG